MNTLDARNDDESAAERRLSGGLSALADWPQPPSGVDLQALVGAGRRNVRRRRGTASLGTTAAFALAAAGVWGIAGPELGRTPTNTVSDQPGHDPMVPTAGFGWLPGPSTGGFGWSLTPSGDFTVDDENGTVSVSLTLQAAGESEPLGPYTPAGTVDGHSAVWLSDMSDPELLWQYKPGAWAELLAEGATKPETTKIADNVRFGTEDAIAMPFHLNAVPPGFTVRGAGAMRNTQLSPVAGDGSLILCPINGTCVTKNSEWQNVLNLSVTTIVEVKQPGGSQPQASTAASTSSLTETGPDPQHSPPNTSTVMIHGVAAKVSVTRGGLVFVTFDIDGLSVTAQAEGTAVNAIGASDGLVRFLDSITWYGDNPSAWTTDVIG